MLFGLPTQDEIDQWDYRERAEGKVMVKIRPPNDPRYKLLEATLLIARYAPKKQGRYVSDAKVPWEYIKRIRKALIELNISLESWDFAIELSRLYESFEDLR
ncbi:hypothetical protein [Meiothermus sp.]|uniref:hypothetical protein n=1 Tax=Meiothermus sp. TaxID=1955249 RepID=UPI0021DD8AEC|nr:hypothetical protein [Meiothermus sp.]GIW33757.1 MAG: hypothetical protein KatS3mg072_1090 [Meiothermus sp.]